ncbi:MAG: hypothetical protein H8E30_09975, partial [Alphaproteobacteria bacterium]|nr:hypothetical protein [Alphaproteobacteria bacterium]
GEEWAGARRPGAVGRNRWLRCGMEGPRPGPGAPWRAGGQGIAGMRPGGGDRGLALVRIGGLAEAGGLGRNLTAGAATVTLLMPDWADFELPELKV